MPLHVVKEPELVVVTKSATCADANFYSRLSYFSEKSRDNCLVLLGGRRRYSFCYRMILSRIT
jgi:hypothetical protein